MRDLAALESLRPFGYFVHHQGRGHAERCAALVNALPEARPVTVFCARDDIFPVMRAGVTIQKIPSLFEPTGDEPKAMDAIATPETVHCAPVGWAGISEAMGIMAGWFAEARPELMICDVSAEVAQLARLCSVPHVKVLQHGDRSDPGHRAAYDGAAGLLAPFAEDLAQPEWDGAMRAKTHFAGGLGVDLALPSRAEARATLGIPEERQMALVISGGGGNGVAEAPLGVGARTYPEMDWIVLGAVQRDWHATVPANLTFKGWVEDCPLHIAAADLVIASTGNTTCAHVLSAARPWLAVPEWRYFDEQVKKAEALARAGAATHLPHLPSSAHAWRGAVEAARAAHDPARQRALVARDASACTADWLERLASCLWRAEAPEISKEPAHV